MAYWPRQWINVNKTSVETLKKKENKREKTNDLKQNIQSMTSNKTSMDHVIHIIIVSSKGRQYQLIANINWHFLTQKK